MFRTYLILMGCLIDRSDPEVEDGDRGVRRGGRGVRGVLGE